LLHRPRTGEDRLTAMLTELVGEMRHEAADELERATRSLVVELGELRATLSELRATVAEDRAGYKFYLTNAGNVLASRD